jgi:drug/metabolite transporter (DMT)-like permease
MAAQELPESPPVDLRVHLGLLAVQASFSGLHVFGKVVLASMHPLALACLRVGFAAPALMLIAWRHDRVLPALRDLPNLALLGTLGVFLNQVLFITGLRLTTATNAAILIASIPVFAVGIGALTGLDRVGGRRALGVLLAVSGNLVVLDPRRFVLGAGSFAGDLLILINSLSFAAFMVLQRPALERLPWRTVLAWSFLCGGVETFAIGGSRLLAVEPHSLPASALWSIVYILLFPTLLSYSLNTWAVGRSTPVTVAVYTSLQPLLTALLAAPVLGERLGWQQLVGFALIAAGIWRVSRRRKALPPSSSSEAGHPRVDA